jgi:DNA-binding NarL/FixJ family response regulator
LPESRIIFLSMYASPAYAAEALKAGAAGYVLKHCRLEELRQAIDTVLAGGRYLTPHIAQEAVERLAQSRSRKEQPARPDLSARQREVLRLVAEGRAAKEIAARLGISVRTVEFHKANLSTRLGLRTTAELTRYAVGLGLVPP